MAAIWTELKRRNVVRVAVAYVIVAWLLLQVADVVLNNIETPTWVFQVILLLLIIGFPVVLIFAWAFELTPEGLKKEKDVGGSESVTHLTGRKLDFTIIGLMAVAILYLVLDNYVLTGLDPLEGLVDVSQPVPGFSNRAAIAVLPFVNLSTDPTQEYFSDGITEDIITGLQSIRIFPIIARTSTFSFKGEATDVREIAETLGAGYILEGSVRRVKDRVRITAQLNDANGRQIWAETYDSELHDVFGVQDEIRHQIVGAIEPQLLLVEMNRSALVRPEDMEAWDYYLQAAADTATFGGYTDRNGQVVTIDRTKRALELAQYAIKLDPAFADAYTLLAHINSVYSLLLRGQANDLGADRVMRDALEHARRGRELSPFSATTCSCYAGLTSGFGLPEMVDLETAVQIQEDAVRLNPANAVARAVLGKIYQNLGRYDEARLEIEVAKRLSPRDRDLSLFLYVEAAIHLGLGDWESAADVARSAILLRPQNYDAHAIRITALYAQGDADGAAAALKLMEKSIPNFSEKMLWDGPLPESLVPSLSPIVDLQNNPTFRQVVAVILDDLGWSPER